MNINLQLNEDMLAKLAQIQKVTHQDLADILHQAIDVYYQKIQTESETPMEIVQKTGFIGCIQAESDLSRNYKSLVRSLVEKRNDNR